MEVEQRAVGQLRKPLPNSTSTASSRVLSSVFPGRLCARKQGAIEIVDFFWIIVPIFIVLAIAGAAWSNVQEGKRTRRWQAVANRPGFHFLGTSQDLLDRCRRLRMFKAGRSHDIQNAVAVDSGALRIVVADLRYRTGSGKNSSTHRYTICALQTADLNMPHCYLRPERRFFDTLGGLLGGKDIDFDEDPQFSAAYVLQGDDEAAVRQVFDEDVRTWFAERVGQALQFEAEGDTLVFHNGKRVSPEDAPEHMDQALQIMKRLAPRARQI